MLREEQAKHGDELGRAGFREGTDDDDDATHAGTNGFGTSTRATSGTPAPKTLKLNFAR